MRVQRIRGYGLERDAAERALRVQRVALPLQQRVDWQRATLAPSSLALVARDAADRALGAIVASVWPSRALPGHSIYRVERMPGIGDAAVRNHLIAALITTARNDSRCLRVVIEVFERDADPRNAMGRALASVGFSRVEQSRMYTHTLAIDLTPDERSMFAALHSTARYNIRAAAKHGLAVRPIADPSMAGQLETLSAETYKRSRASSDLLPWKQIIELSTAQPELSRIVGVFDERTPDEPRLVAYAWGCAHGTYATYEAGASVRRAELKNAPLGYAPLWELIRWARDEAGAQWFDLGGINPAGTPDILPGISRFKRYFSDEAVLVGDEWILEPHRARAAVARAISVAANWASARAEGRRGPTGEGEAAAAAGR